MKSFYKTQCTEGLDLSVSCIEDLFQSARVQIYLLMEIFLMQASKQDDPAADLHYVCDFYKADIDRQLLQSQFKN